MLGYKLLNERAIAPQRGTSKAAGIDLFCMEDFDLAPGDDIVLDSGIAFQIPEGICLEVMTKSGMGLKRKVSTSIGAQLIDQDYRGEAHIQLYNFGKEVQSFKRGDKVCQLRETPVIYDDLVEMKEISTDTERGVGYAGSTGTNVNS